LTAEERYLRDALLGRDQAIVLRAGDVVCRRCSSGVSRVTAVMLEGYCSARCSLLDRGAA
jgi:hypothetical protein